MSDRSISDRTVTDARPIIAFIGPCLPRDLGAGSTAARWTAALDGVELWPPARRGDVLRALGRRPRTLVLIDGFYYNVPSVAHKELLYALDSGVTVVGAASMGALRAAEMAPLGMVGIGRVFELYDSGELDGDDEVALLHTAAEDGYRALTSALVELRHALGELLRERGLAESRGRALLEALKALPFTERDPVGVRELARQHLPEIDARQLLERVRDEGIKRRDALEALEWVRHEPRTAQEKRANREFTAEAPASPAAAPLITTLFDQYRGWALGPPARTDQESPRQPPTYLQAWQVTQLFHPEVEAFLAQQRRRFLLATAAGDAGVHAPRERVDAWVDRLERRLGGLPLPALEIAAEAEIETLAEAARRAFEGEAACAEEHAASIVARRFGFSARGALDRLLALLATQGDLLRPWALARSLLFTPARDPALALAEAAYQVQRAWSAWSRGGRLTRREVCRIAGAIFDCAPEHCEEQGARRGLLTYTAGEASPGTLAEAVSLVAAAERLPKPVNDYVPRRAELTGSELIAG